MEHDADSKFDFVEEFNKLFNKLTDSIDDDVVDNSEDCKRGDKWEFVCSAKGIDYSRIIRESNYSDAIIVETETVTDEVDCLADKLFLCEELAFALEQYYVEQPEYPQVKLIMYGYCVDGIQYYVVWPSNCWYEVDYDALVTKARKAARRRTIVSVRVL